MADELRNLLLIGGGDRPPEAMRFFLEKARRHSKADILVVGWASCEPEEAFACLKADLKAVDPESEGFMLESSASPPQTAAETQALLASIRRATGIFFGGGDQARIMDGLADPIVKEALLQAYANGTIFGGTSAGTAIMSSRMIYGHDSLDRVDSSLVWLREGLGILPSTILDQHFFRRGRHNRLFGALTEHPCHLAIGVDEDASLLVTNEQHARVIGGQVLIANSKDDSFSVTILNCGDQYDLKGRRRELARR